MIIEPECHRCVAQARVRIGAARGRAFRRRGLVFFSTIVLVSVHARASLAEVDPASATQVEEQLQRGIELRKEGRDAEALEAFRVAYQYDKSPRIRAQIAVAEQALGHWVEAERGLLIVLAAKDDSWIKERRAALELALGRVRARLGSIIVQSNVAGAELWIDGSRAVVLPTVDPLRVVVGTHQLEVRAEGYATAQRTVEVASNGRAQERFMLTALPAAGPRSLAAANASTSAGRSTAPVRLSQSTWVAAGLFGGFLTAGATALAIREINAAQYNDASRCVVGSLSRDERCAHYRETANGAEFVAIGAFAGAALAAVGVGLSLMHDLTAVRTEGVSIACVPSAGSVVCEGRF